MKPSERIFMIGKGIISEVGSPTNADEALDIRIESISRYLDEQAKNPLIEHLRLLKENMLGQLLLGPDKPNVNAWSNFAKSHPILAEAIEELLKK